MTDEDETWRRKIRPLQAFGVETSVGADAGGGGGSFESLGFRQSVLGYFPTFTQQFEGKVPNMYLDDAQPPGPYVTTWVGNLIDPISTAMDLPWVHKSDNTPASQAEIAAEWNLVKSRKDLAPKGGGAFAGITNLKLLDKDGTNLLLGKVLANEHILISRYPNLADWPADAQLGLLSMSWALGPAFNFPLFKSFTDKLDFGHADLQSEYKGVGSAPRIAADHKLFQNAAYVLANNLDRNTVWYPGSPAGGGGSGGGFFPSAEEAKLGAAIALPLLLAGGGLTLWLMSQSKASRRLDQAAGI